MPYARWDADDAGRLRREVDLVLRTASRGAVAAVEERDTYVAAGDEVAVRLVLKHPPALDLARADRETVGVDDGLRPERVAGVHERDQRAPRVGVYSGALQIYAVNRRRSRLSVPGYRGLVAAGGRSHGSHDMVGGTSHVAGV